MNLGKVRNTKVRSYVVIVPLAVYGGVEAYRGLVRSGEESRGYHDYQLPR